MAEKQANLSDEIERVKTLVRRALLFWRRALVVFIVGALLVVPFVFTRPRSWKSETVILYHETMRSSEVTGGGDSADTAHRAGPRLREVLLSRASLEPIITEMGILPKTASSRSMVDAVDTMRKKIFFRAREGDTFEISYEGDTPEQAQEITRRLGDSIIQEATQVRSQRANSLKDFLTAESATNSADLKNKEAELARFVALHPGLTAKLRRPDLLPAPTPAGVAPAAGTPAIGDPILASIEGRAARIERQLARAGGAPEPAPIPPPVFRPPPDSAELIAAKKDLAEKSALYTEKHPDVSAARARVRVAEEAQAAAHAAAVEAHAAAVASARAQALEPAPAPKNAADEAALRAQLNDLRMQAAQRRAQFRGDAGTAAAAAVVAPPPGEFTGSAVDLEVDFRRLERDVADARERQHQLDDRLFKASLTASSVMSDRNIQVSILDPAYLPAHPVSKPRTFMLAGLLIVVLLISFAIALLSARVDDRVHDRIDLERLDVLPILGVIPRALPPKD